MNDDVIWLVYKIEQLKREIDEKQEFRTRLMNLLRKGEQE
jgi:hypothetical protein